MVLNVLLCAGAVPLQPEERPQQRQVHPQQDSAEYVQFLEQLVGELSQVFSQWVHQNPPNASQMNDTRARNITRNTSRGLSPLPDVIPHNEKKCSSYQRAPATSTAPQQLRARRGLGPMRCRLDSVGSVVSNSSTPTSPSPMTFDLLTPTPSSPVAFFCDDDYYYPYGVTTPVTPLPASPPATLPAVVDDDENDDDHEDVVDAQDAAALQWRHVGRDLRGIAHQFATTRRSSNTQGSSSSWWLLSALSPLTSPLVSAFALYLWCKLFNGVTKST